MFNTDDDRFKDREHKRQKHHKVIIPSILSSECVLG